MEGSGPSKGGPPNPMDRLGGSGTGWDSAFVIVVSARVRKGQKWPFWPRGHGLPGRGLQVKGHKWCTIRFTQLRPRTPKLDRGCVGENGPPQTEKGRQSGEDQNGPPHRPGTEKTPKGPDWPRAAHVAVKCRQMLDPSLGPAHRGPKPVPPLLTASKRIAFSYVHLPSGR